MPSSPQCGSRLSEMLLEAHWSSSSTPACVWPRAWGQGPKQQGERPGGQLSTEVSASVPSASAAVAASSWATEVSWPTSLWGHELMTMTLWSGELLKAMPQVPSCPGPTPWSLNPLLTVCPSGPLDWRSVKASRRSQVGRLWDRKLGGYTWPGLPICCPGGLLGSWCLPKPRAADCTQ